jgi:hypothetical protein
MRTWLPLVVTGAFTLLAALGGVALGQWLQRKHVREAAVERRRDEARPFSLRSKPSSSMPTRSASRCSMRSSTRKRRCLDLSRNGEVGAWLLRLSIRHPSASVRDLAEETEKALHRAMASASMFLRAVIRHESDQNLYDRAMREHEQASGAWSGWPQR